jgi:inner membrane protein
MLKRTHLAVAFANGFYFLPYVSNKILFFPVVLLATLLPDIDTAFSSAGRHGIFRPVQWVFTHRGVIHSYTLAIFLSLLLAFFYPILAFPFFLGYSFHLFLDAFTVRGIQPFWPFKKRAEGMIRTGGAVENAIFVVVLIVDIGLLIKLFI